MCWAAGPHGFSRHHDPSSPLHVGTMALGPLDGQRFGPRGLQRERRPSSVFFKVAASPVESRGSDSNQALLYGQTVPSVGLLAHLYPQDSIGVVVLSV